MSEKQKLKQAEIHQSGVGGGEMGIVAYWKFIAGVSWAREILSADRNKWRDFSYQCFDALKNLSDACEGEMGCWCGEKIRGETVEVCPRCQAENVLDIFNKPEGA